MYVTCICDIQVVETGSEVVRVGTHTLLPRPPAPRGSHKGPQILYVFSYVVLFSCERRHPRCSERSRNVSAPCFLTHTHTH